MLFSIHDEFLQFFAELRYLSSLLTRADQLVFALALLMLVGVFLPWVSADGILTQTGLMGGGDVHMFLAIWAIIQVKSAAMYQIKSLQDLNQLPTLNSRLRRISLNYLMIGAGSIIASIFVLVYCGSQYHDVHGTITVRFGFYLTAISGLFISFCGLERFNR